MKKAIKDKENGTLGYGQWLRKGGRSNLYQKLYYDVRRKYSERGAGEIDHIPSPNEVRRVEK